MDLGRRASRCRGGFELPALGLEVGDLLGDQTQPGMLAGHLGKQRRRYGMAIAGAQLTEPRRKAGVPRLRVADPLGMQQRLDAVDMSAALADQALALAGPPAGILLGDRGHRRHAAHLGLAPAIGEQRAHQRFEIEAVYDNSEKNPNNPSSPPIDVRFGEQTTSEMLFGFLLSLRVVRVLIGVRHPRLQPRELPASYARYQPFPSALL